ncbi:AMP-binding protein [Nannocystis pusilla]|uniref:AMP-binding protein n=1 Tax=Nannocystis pusilla TaxID=889268 RepID=UPI003B774E0E
MADPTWPEALAADRRLAVVYTSGSTGDHQPCAKTAAQLLGEAQALAATFALRAGEVALATVPPYHLYGLLFGILAPLAAGRRSPARRRCTPRRWPGRRGRWRRRCW